MLKRCPMCKRGTAQDEMSEVSVVLTVDGERSFESAFPPMCKSCACSLGYVLMSDFYKELEIPERNLTREQKQEYIARWVEEIGGPPRYYAEPAWSSPLLNVFLELDDDRQERALILAERYMDAFECVACPVCDKGDKQMYDGTNDACVECWYGQLERFAREVAANE